MKLLSRFLVVVIFSITIGTITEADGQSLLSPSANGVWGNSFYGGGGIVAPQVGGSLADMTGVMGFGLGNPHKNLGIQTSLWMNDVSDQSDFTLCLKLHRKIQPGSSIAIGSNHLWVQQGVKISRNWYGVFSHDFASNFPNRFWGKFSFTAGYGTGKFTAYKLSDNSITNLGAFGTLSYAILKSVKWELEWDGFEWNTGFKVSGNIFNFPVGIMIGAADVTGTYSGRTRMMATFGIGYDLW